jgi:copper(I)-binding protein
MTSSSRLALTALVAIGALALFVVAFAPERKTRPTVTDAIAFADPMQGSALLISMNIANDSTTPDRLLDVRAPTGELTLDGAEPGPDIPVPNGMPVSLTPEAAHLRYERFDGTLEDGLLIPLTLQFEQAGEVNVKARYKADPDPMALHMAMGHGMSASADEPVPEISISATPQGDLWQIDVETQKFQFSQEMADGPHEPGFGHGHLYIGGAKIGRLYTPRAVLQGLPKGSHLVRVTLNTNNHQTYLSNGEPVSAVTTIEVE